MATPDPVEQARTWLLEQGAEPVPPPAPTTSRSPATIQAAGGHPDRLPPDAGAPDGPDADPESVARTIALRKLTAQARTRHELDQALRRKGVPPEVSTSVLDRLEEIGVVDDEAFAQEWVESRQQRRHLSRTALRRELRARGVDRDRVDAALAAVAPDDELAAARALIAKKAGATRGLAPLVRHRRLAGALARRGFGSGIIATVLDELGDGPAKETGA